MHPQIYTPTKIFKPEDITMESLRHMDQDSFPIWALTSGATADGHKVSFEKHRYLLPVYADPTSQIAVIKAAQLGLTVFLLLRQIWWLKMNQGRKGALYFPTKEAVELLAQDRLDPLLMSCPDVWKLITESGKQSNRMALKHLGKSSFYLFHLGGKASKDSTPLDYLSFDEVRLMNDADIFQALERVSASDHKIKIFASTAGLPNSNIDRYYNMGTRHHFRVNCGCSDGCDLAKSFPECIIETPRGVVLICPKCRYQIKDRQHGRYVADNPGGDYNSYRMSQLNSAFLTPDEIWLSYLTTTNIKEFYNAKLGLPYVDSENQPVKMEHCLAAVEPDLPWAEPNHVTNKTAMGVDQGAGYCYVVIMDIVGGRKRLRHLEIIEATNPYYMEDGKLISPFIRLRQIMKEYNVGLAVVDAMPNANDALEFAQDFPGKVFLSFYNNDAKEPVTWRDKAKTKEALRKAGPFFKFKYTVTINRYMGLDTALMTWANGDIITPDPKGLVQIVRSERTGMFEPERILERWWSHLQRLIRQFHETNEETHEGRFEFIYNGGDPHGAHAFTYANVAVERLRRATGFIFA